MTKLEQAARQALEALEKAEMVYAVRDVHPMAVKQVEGAIIALREALAEQNKLRAMRAQVYPSLLTESPFEKLAEQAEQEEQEKPLLVQAWEKRFTEQAEQEPVRKRCKRCNDTGLVSDGEIDNIGGAPLEVSIECVKDCPDCAAPVRTKDLTDDEILPIAKEIYKLEWVNDAAIRYFGLFARAVIAADREKNRA